MSYAQETPQENALKILSVILPHLSLYSQRVTIRSNLVR